MTGHWLDEYLPAAFREALPQWEWMEDRAEADEHREYLIETYQGGTPMGLLFVPALMRMCEEHATHRLLVAHMERTTPAFCEDPHRYCAELYVDDRYPGKLFFSPHSEIPALLWIEIDADVDSVTAVLAEYDPNASLDGNDYPRSIRAFAGHVADIHVPNIYDGESEEHAGPHEIERCWVFSPLVERYFWGSAHASNPWRVHREPTDYLLQSHLIGRYGKQALGHVCTRSRLTRHSRACLRMEFHGRGYMAWQVDYRPSRFTKTIERFNEHTDMNYPTDLPVDVFGATLGFHFASAAQTREVLIERLTDDGDWDQAYFNLKEWMAVAYPEPDFEDQLEMFYASGSNRIARTLINAGIEYQRPGIWQRLLPHCENPDYVEFMQKHLAEDQLPHYPVDENGEPEDFFAEIPSDD